MLKAFSKSLNSSNTHTYKIIIITIIILIIFLVYCLIEPLIKSIFFSSTTYEGTHFFFEEKYTDFENGDDFEKFITSLTFIDDCETVNFTYTDNSIKDCILFGERCNIFSLDMYCVTNMYNNIKSSLIETNKIIGDLYDYELYHFKNDNLGIKEMVLFAFNDEIQTIRCIMITNIKNNSDVISLLIHNSSLNWG